MPIASYMKEYRMWNIKNKYPIQMHLQTLEIIGFKESVKKSTSRIQVKLFFLQIFLYYIIHT